MAEGPVSSQDIDNREHIDPLKTGDNIPAKRVALYGYYPGGSVWNRLQVDTNGVVQTSGSGGGGGGSVTQGTIPWQSSICDGTNTANIIAPLTQPSLTQASLSVGITPNNNGLPVNLPIIVQKISNVSSGTVSSLTATFGSSTTKGNAVVVVFAIGNTNVPTVSDSNSNPYAQITTKNNGIVASYVHFSSITTGGADTVTVTNTGSATSMAMEVYEVSGVESMALIADASGGNNSTSTSPGLGLVNPSVNDYQFMGIGVQTATSTITPPSGWTNDSGQLNPTAPSNLFSFASMSRFFALANASQSNNATLGTSEPWVLVTASFKPVALNTNITSLPAITGTVGSNSATGSAVPSNAFYIGGNNGANLTGLGTVGAYGDGANGSTSGILTIGTYIYNGTNYDRQRNNVTGALMAAGTTSTTTQTLTTYNASKLLFAVNITSGAGTVTVAISGTTSSGYTYPILTSTALTGVADNTLRIFPGATPATNVTANDMVPRNISVTATVVGTISYGIDYVLSI